MSNRPPVRFWFQVATLWIISLLGPAGLTYGQASEKTLQNSPPQNKLPVLHLKNQHIAPPPIQVSVDWVTIPVTVTDQYGHIATGLDASNFKIYDNRVRQKILSFSSQDAPIAVGIIFDTSGSMSGNIEASKQAALEFFKTSNPQDEFALIDFASEPELLSGFTSSFKRLEDRLLFLKTGGRTALLDAIYMGLMEMHKADTQRKALLVISDGGDNHSRYTEREVKRAILESDVQIYVIGIFDDPGGSGVPELQEGPALLNSLAHDSGGRMFPIGEGDIDELPDIAEKISIELRNEYVIAYKPSNLVRDGRWRTVRVKLDPPRGVPPLIAHARIGYYAPTQ